MSRAALLALPLTLCTVFYGEAWAGPPFLTDDPEPVEYQHWEFYLAAQGSAARHAGAGSLPQVEVNYGALPRLQLHVIIPAAVSWSDDTPVRYGLGGLELGVKFRFVDEGTFRPQIGVFPLATLGTGSDPAQGFVPVWLQKSIGSWTTYGGGGVRFTSADHAVVLGWLLQRHISEKVVVGVEAYLSAPLSTGDTAQVQFNLGSVINFSERHHLLLSAGPSFGGEGAGQAYLAYQLTI